MSKVERLKAQLVMVVGFLCLHFLLQNKFPEISKYLLYVALGLGLVFLIIPALGDIILKRWFKFAELLGWINSRILLTGIFYILLFPIAMLFKLTGKDNLQLKSQKDNDTVYERRNHKYVPKDLENTW
jgi:Kef-type K+ transport system membrane component KefB